jgi:nucleotide-binding universal stress UspA family protein
MTTERQKTENVSDRENNSHEVDRDFQKILVAIDESSASDRVLAKAIELAEKYGSCLKIYHCTKEVIPVTSTTIALGHINPYGGVYSREIYEAEDRLRQEAETRLELWLQNLVKQASDRNVRAEFEYHIGDPGKRICDLAMHWQANLIIIGRRGRTGLSEILLGSVSNYVVHHAPCSVFIVQSNISNE